MGTRNDRHLTMTDLVGRIDAGEVDTVIVAFTDMQGRLQGKRMTAQHSQPFAVGRPRSSNGAVSNLSAFPEAAADCPASVAQASTSRPVSTSFQRSNRTH